ncbi:ADP-ribosylglycohydrolase family protein [Pseudonocardia nigra]|uniref:ADP-ribosylglycohydrolase family protein n=1 Tax=Pseudonocardia nigra TaxID=1921578 RepID=UPI001C5E7A32|nr:ADP-ribosylglycohydrolase family protein [Pseudonocardia nigra]
MNGGARRQRARATIAGLVLADGLAWPSLWHRLSLLPARRTERLQEIDVFAVRMRTTTRALPYLHASPPQLVDAAGRSDDTEWFAVSALFHTGRGLDGQPTAEPLGVWAELARLRSDDPSSVRARTGTVVALENLARGLAPPQSGHDNPHYFDDIACVRALAAGLQHAGDAGAAARAADTDAQVTHAEDGVWCARATAVLVAELVDGAPVERAVAQAAGSLPEGSWSAGVVEAALRAVEADQPSALALARALEQGVVDPLYSFAIAAPETLALLLAHLRRAAGPEELLLGALAHPRHADALVPLAGAVAGAAFGPAWLPADLLAEPPVLRGICVPQLAGQQLGAVLDIDWDIDRVEGTTSG